MRKAGEKRRGWVHGLLEIALVPPRCSNGYGGEGRHHSPSELADIAPSGPEYLANRLGGVLPGVAYHQLTAPSEVCPQLTADPVAVEGIELLADARTRLDPLLWESLREPLGLALNLSADRLVQGQGIAANRNRHKCLLRVVLDRRAQGWWHESVG